MRVMATMRLQTVDQWLGWLETLHPKAIDLGLQRVAAVAGQMDVMQFDACVITVAGTNGKGSTVAALQALLSEPRTRAAQAARIGTYTSPHLQRFNERIQIAGQPVDDNTLCAAFARVDRARLAVADDSSDAPALTYFEFTTLAALSIFQHANLDYIVLEVGLGGRLDAVNVVDTDLAIITSIALDHQQWLGSTRDAIALEKAGILRSAAPAIIGDSDPPKSLQQFVRQHAVSAVWAAPAPGSATLAPAHGFIATGETLQWCGCDHAGGAVLLDELPPPRLAAANWSCALQAVSCLDALPPASAVARLMRSTGLPGRRSWHEFKGRRCLFDVAHNPAAIHSLADELRAIRSAADAGKITLVFAALADKEVQAMLALLLDCVDQWIFAQLAQCPRAMEAVKMRELLQQLLRNRAAGQPGIAEAPSVATAMQMAQASCSARDTIVVCGSFYTVGEALDVLASPGQAPAGE
ncbi:MAG: bifunctional folylpolyglutamate synthase/dihydrofolate synthase [Gammaproteobacteria bacterium]|nr:bifunctional folylpolyglutamate synthase/dihydrofolate synthase [Gammaproteobacteria bacterium]